MNIETLREAELTVRENLSGCAPRCALILGSGWGVAASDFPVLESLDYSEIPHLGSTQVKGHSGRLVLTEIGGMEILAFHGRRHWYEGIGWEPIALPVYVSAKLGIETIVLTNAGGGSREDLVPGDLMVIDDHINAMGCNPLSGGHDAVWGPRFPDQTTVYDANLRCLLDDAASSTNTVLRHGVYLAAAGPAYETPAEINAYRTMGADAVGMSTVPEAMLAHAAGLRVAGISCITNLAAGISGSPLSHDEVVAETRRAEPRMKALLTDFLSLVANQE